MSEIIQNIAVIIASLTAVYGIISWRKEHIGRRKIDLAEEVLSSVYEIKDVIRSIRSPFGFVGEGKTRKRGQHETSEQSEILDNAYVVYERYNKNIEVFNSFYRLKYRFKANFGLKAEEPFLIVRKIIAHIFAASNMLSSVYWKNQGRKQMSEAEFQRHLEGMEKNEAIFWEMNDDDEINTKISEAIEICEEICKSINNTGLKNYFKKYR